jgi:hypothetical protein
MQVQKKLRMAYIAMSGLTLIVLMGASAAAFAAGAAIEMRPATFEHPSLSLESLLRKATDFTTMAIVHCETLITARGRFSRTYCYNSTPRKTAYENKVLRMITFARATPAVVADKKIKVWLQFGVHYNPSERSLKVVAHPETNLESFGTDYVGPQRYRRPANCPAVSLEPHYVQYVVDTSGIAKVELVHNTSQPVDVTGKYQRCYRRTRFIPASRDGLPVISRVLEVHFGLRQLTL